MRISDWSSDVCSSDLEEFYQANCPPRSGERPGLGLGLATVQRLCALLEIPITLHSQLGHGCLFSVHVPMAATPRPEIAAPAASDQPLDRSEEHTSELQSLMRISYAVFFLQKNKQ